MKIRLLAGFLCAGMLFAPLMPAATAAKKKPAMSEDMREAIAFERHKDQADARQARIEAARQAGHSADRTQNPAPPAGKK
ncbi:MAG TPA: hypothetical protein VE959_23545 [Bryobacteraceae bacterium]|nr:hypothetical protein [Bryobacteraceae bacterium]